MVTIIQVPSPNFRAGNWKKEGFILHHMAGYLPGTDSIFRRGGSTGIATHYGVGSRNGKGDQLEVHQYVQDQNRSFGSYNADGDSRALSIEIENTYPNIGKPSPAVHELVAQLMAQKAVEHGMRLPLMLGDYPDHRYYRKDIPGLGSEFQVTTHRSMALKNCPNDVDVVWITARANELVGQGGAPTYTPSAPAYIPAPAPVQGWDFWRPDKETQRRIQQLLKNRRRYAGRVDGVWGTLSIAAIQLTLRNVGYTGALDGIPGPMTCYYVQVYAQRFGDYQGSVDKLLGKYSWIGFELGLFRP